MTERENLLGDDSWRLSAALGNDVYKRLEDGEGGGVLSEAHLLLKGGTRLLGYLIDEPGKGWGDVRKSLSSQMGLPPGSGWLDLKSRLAGRESELACLILGTENLSSLQKLFLKAKLKGLGIKILMD